MPAATMTGERTASTSPSPPVQPPAQSQPTVACLRCRDQKLKCDRALPTCMRCRKQRACCKYPPPPDRRRIAQRKATAQARAAEAAAALVLAAPRVPASVSVSAASASPEPPWTTQKRPRTSDGPDVHAQGYRGDSESDHGDRRSSLPPADPTDVDADDDQLPSTEVGLLLLEVFFKRVYNATLLFHKSITFHLYRQKRLPTCLLRAIFAHAALFLAPVETAARCRRYIRILPVPALHQRSWAWARAASREALAHADEPTLVRAQTLQVLQLYYFARGEIRRAVVHASLAFRLCQLLGYDRLREGEGEVPVIDDGPDRRTGPASPRRLDREIKRRCFWAAWCSFCIGGRRLDGSWASTCERMVAGLPLPVKLEPRLARGAQITDWDLSPHALLPDPGPACSLMADLVRLLGIWSNIQILLSSDCHSRPTPDSQQRAAQFAKYLAQLEPIECALQLPLVDLTARADTFDESPELLTSVCSVYYLNRLLLHASLASMTTTTKPSAATRKHAELALQQAVAFAELMRQFVAKDLDMTRLFPLLGYVAFVAGSVIRVYQNTPQLTDGFSIPVPGLASEEMKTLETVLEVLSIYWKPLRRLARKLSQVNTSTNQPIGLASITSTPYPWVITRSSDGTNGDAGDEEEEEQIKTTANTRRYPSRSDSAISLTTCAPRPALGSGNLHPPSQSLQLPPTTFLDAPTAVPSTTANYLFPDIEWPPTTNPSISANPPWDSSFLDLHIPATSTTTTTATATTTVLDSGYQSAIEDTSSSTSAATSTTSTTLFPDPSFDPDAATTTASFTEWWNQPLAPMDYWWAAYAGGLERQKGVERKGEEGGGGGIE